MSVRLIPFTEDMCINESPAPVTESDTINLVDKERELNINDPMGDNPFMTSEKNYSRRILEDKVRSYIKLCVPVINTLITDANNNIAINILNLSRKEINEIIKGQVIYDTYEDKLISAREALPGESYLYGGEIIEHIVNNYNTEDEIIKELEKIILDNFYKKKERECNPITVCKSSDIGNILPEYDLKVNFYGEKVESDIEIINWFKYTYIKNHPVSKLTALLRLKENVLDSLYTRTIRVLPRGMRPMIDGRSDSMTVMYSDLLRIDKVLRRLTDADKDIKQSSRVSQPAIYAAKYRNLQYAFDFLVSCTEKQREERTKSTDKNRKRKSIFQYTSTKQGHIRDDMLKKVQDFSGRSVIVADPDLSVDEVRLPKEMADVVMRYHTKIKHEKNQSLDEVIKHVPVVINRAPTLHRLSLRGYKVKISDNNSIGVNPLSAEGFNFDHDGDTMAVHVPISDEAIREVNELFDVKRNLFIPASGKVTLMPK